MAPANRPSATRHGRVEWVDTDASGVYHNSAVLRYVEAAEAALMRDHGVAGHVPSAPRVHYEVDFESPLFFGQAVETVITIERVGRTSMTFVFEVWGDPDGERTRAAKGSYTVVHVEVSDAPSEPGRPGRMQPSPWPTEWLAALGLKVDR